MNTYERPQSSHEIYVTLTPLLFSTSSRLTFGFIVCIVPTLVPIKNPHGEHSNIYEPRKTSLWFVHPWTSNLPLCSPIYHAASGVEPPHMQGFSHMSWTDMLDWQNSARRLEHWKHWGLLSWDITAGNLAHGATFDPAFFFGSKIWWHPVMTPGHPVMTPGFPLFVPGLAVASDCGSPISVSRIWGR